MDGLDIERFPEFDNHKLVSFVFDERAGLRGFIAIHRGGVSNPVLGATRFWNYASESDALADALRLSRMMSYKSALAGLKYGGAKAALINGNGSGPRDRAGFFTAYAQRINYLGGKFITGTDVGVTDEDVKVMRKTTPYVIGAGVKPAYYTALGVFFGMGIALKRVFGSERFSGRSFAVQGLGKTGVRIIDLLYRDTQRIAIADVNADRVREAKKRFPKVKVVSPDTVHWEDVDVFVPCALSGSLNAKSVGELKCKIVAGSANNQLAGEHIGSLLHQLGILYAPDYVINAGGLLSVVEELEHESPSEKRILEKVKRIPKMLQTIFDRSKKKNCSTNAVANEMAERIFNNHN